MPTESIGLPRSRKPTYIKEQNNYNCQQFFGNISGSTFVMPTPQTQSLKPKKQTATKKTVNKPQSTKPMTLKYYRHGNNGLLTGQRKRVDILYKKWTEWGWIDPDTKPDDFDAFFEGEPRHCNITWKTNATVLTILLQELLKQDFIDRQTGCSAKSLVKEQFGKEANSDKTRLGSTNEERIRLSIIILDINNPMPNKNKNYTSNDEDYSDAALHEVYSKHLRTTKGI